MAKSYGNSASNIFVVTNSDGYDSYNGLGGNDIYNVNPQLTDNVSISDSNGDNSIVLGNAEIVSARFTSTAAQFTYATGGVLTVTSNSADRLNFVFGGGSNAFDAVQGGTSLSFQEMVQAFGVNPANLGPAPVDALNTGILRSDGTIYVAAGTAVNMEAGQTYTATDDPDVFVYEFSDYMGSNYDPLSMAGLDGTVTINSFNAAQDIIRFVDKDGNPPSKPEFLGVTNGFEVVPNGFDNLTTVSLYPYYGEAGTDQAVASDIILQGVVLNKADIQIEVV